MWHIISWATIQRRATYVAHYKLGNNSKSHHQLCLVVQLALEVVEIKQTTTRLEINSEKKFFRKKRNRRWDAIISEQIVLSKFFSLKSK